MKTKLIIILAVLRWFLTFIVLYLLVYKYTTQQVDWSVYESNACLISYITFKKFGIHLALDSRDLDKHTTELFN